jgi:hypothetical protein
MKFELLAPHVLVVDGISRLVEAGAIVDAATVPGFVATPHMKPLDYQAFEMVKAACAAIRANQRRGARRGDPNVPGLGHSSGWPAGANPFPNPAEPTED